MQIKKVCFGRKKLLKKLQESNNITTFVYLKNKLIKLKQMVNEAILTLDEVKEKYLNDLNRIGADEDIITNDSSNDFGIIENLKAEEGRHFILSDYYYSSNWKIGDNDEWKNLSKYNWRCSIVITIQRIDNNLFKYSYGI